jgi:hypothetical protein
MYVRNAFPFLLMLALPVASASAQAPCESALLPSPSTSLYAISVALSDETLIVSDPNANAQVGAVYVYEHTLGGWMPSGQLVQSGGLGGFGYGWALDLEGDRAAVGSTGEGGSTGAAYVFERQAGAWTQTARLTASDASVGADFGSAVALDGDRLVVGAYLDDQVNPQGGAAYVFELIGGTWTETTELHPSDSAGWKAFGANADADDGTIVVSGNDNSLYVFEQAGGAWVETAKLVGGGGLDPTHAVAIHGRTIFAGNFQAPPSGTVRVYDGTGPGWAPAGQLTPVMPGGWDGFGLSVDVEDDVAVIGAWGADLGLGAVFVFDRVGTTWTQRAGLSASSGAATPGLGWMVALSGDTAVGAAQTLGAGPSAAYVFGGIDPWTDLGGALPSPTSDPILNAVGSLCPGDLIDLTVSGAPSNALVVYAIGTQLLNAPFKGGLMVPDPLLLVGVFADAAGTASLVAPSPAGLPPSLDVIVQAWMADLGGVFGYSASSAVFATVP